MFTERTGYLRIRAGHKVIRQQCTRTHTHMHACACAHACIDTPTQTQVHMGKPPPPSLRKHASHTQRPLRKHASGYLCKCTCVHTYRHAYVLFQSSLSFQGWSWGWCWIYSNHSQEASVLLGTQCISDGGFSRLCL